MTSEHENMKVKVPLYVSGQLSPEEALELENALTEDAELADTLTEFQEIAALYPDLEESTPYPDEELQFARIQQRIRTAEEGCMRTVPGDAGWRHRMTTLFGHLFGSPRFAWTVAVAQLAVILVFAWSLPGDRPFTTLSGSSLSPVEDRQVINVVFVEDTTEKEIRELLREMEADIVGGPLDRGLYRIAVAPDRPVEQVVRQLEASGVIRLAQPVYSSGSE